MAKKFLVAIDLAKNELQNGVVQNLAAAPSSPVKGQIYMNSSDNTLYFYDGTTWQSAKGGLDTTAGDARYVNVGGDTMTGDLNVQTTIKAGPTGSLAMSGPTGNAIINLLDTGGTLRLQTGSTSRLTLSDTSVTVGAGVDLILDADPTLALEAATKQYVDNLINGLAWKDMARAATTANITLSAAQTIDGVACVVGDRVLVKNQTTASQNGLYLVASGAWTRTTDADSEADLVNMCCFISEGSTQADTAWVLTTSAPITVNTTSLTYSQFGAGSTFVGGAGLVLSGNTFNVGAGTGITVNADDVALNTTYTDGRYALLASGAKRYAVDVGGATSQVITHSLGTLDVIIQVYRKASPFDNVECDIEHTSTTTATLRFTTAPAAAEYRCVVLA